MNNILSIEVSESNSIRGNCTLEVQVNSDRSYKVLSVEGEAYVRAVDEGEDDARIDAEWAWIYPAVTDLIEAEID